MAIRSFVGKDPGNIDTEIIKYFYKYKEYHPYAKIVDVKVTSTVRPVENFCDNRGFATETEYLYVVIIEDRGGYYERN